MDTASVDATISMSSNQNHQTWPEVLTALTGRAGDLEGFVRAQGLHDKVQRVRETPGVARRLTAWVSRCCEAKYSKSGGMASRIRDEGNTKFAARDNRGALKLYSESVVCSPKWGPELAWAYGNRSAALYHLGYYEACIQDVDLAMKHRFPKDSLYKLYQRRGLCQMKLGSHVEALASLEDALANLDIQPTSSPKTPSTKTSGNRMSIKKKASLTKDIRAILAEVQSTVKEQEGSRFETKDKESKIPRLVENTSFPGAAQSIALEKDEKRGRHVIAKRNIKVGEILFVERPYCSVLLPEQYASHCHHCHASVEVPVPCLECTQPRYCSDECRQSSWDDYHRFECGGLDLLNSVGVAHLALRAVLTCGVDKLREIRPFVDRKTATLPKGSDISGDYVRILALIEHSSSAQPEDLYQYSLTAVLLTTYLQQRTNFFSGNPNSVKSSEAEADELFAFVSLVLLKHILQLVCNASAIFHVSPIPSATSEGDDSGCKEVYTESQRRIATALYPSASMMNHACEPNVVSNFCGATIVVRAVKNISEGHEVFNCYGPHLRRHSRRERQDMLLSQYNFECQCSGCRDPKFNDLTARFSALRCQLCEDGALRNPEFEEENKNGNASFPHELVCLDCGQRQKCTEQIERAFRASNLFSESETYLHHRDLNQAIESLVKCLSIRKDCLYKHNQELAETGDRLAECYAMAGKFKQARICLQTCLFSVSFRYGPTSIEYAHELIKYSDVVQAELEEACMTELNEGSGVSSRVEMSSLRSEAETTLAEAVSILSAHYGEEDDRCKEARTKLGQLKL